jgi:hypothetical protein
MGTAQAIVGGQPLLIVGVAEPIVLIYSFMYSFATGAACMQQVCPPPAMHTCLTPALHAGQERLGAALFLPWAAWVCIWTAAMIFLLSAVSICRQVSRFTRLSGELFGFLIAVLFMQQAIKGTRSEFLPSAGPHAVRLVSCSTPGCKLPST